jgi:large-conductance mechanosensitive channel
MNEEKNTLKETIAMRTSQGTKVVLTPVNKFFLFLQNKSIIPLAIGVIIADTVKQIVNALVDGIIRPFIGLFSRGSNDFAPLNVEIGGVLFKFGDLISVLLQTFIIFVILYVVLVWLFKNEELLGIKSKESDEKPAKKGKKKLK